MMSLNIQTAQMEPRTAGEWFQCPPVLNIFYGVISMVSKSGDHEKVWSIRFLQ